MLHLAPAPPSVYLVDDDQALRTALKFSLELEGFDVQTYESGEDLLRANLPRRGGCLVLDQNLPGLSGLEALSVLRSRAVKLPALLITSHLAAALRETARNARATLVEKPLLGDVLVGSIWRALREAKAS
jgi:FixJ family two-component response regulator